MQTNQTSKPARKEDYFSLFGYDFKIFSTNGFDCDEIAFGGHNPQPGFRSIDWRVDPAAILVRHKRKMSWSILFARGIPQIDEALISEHRRAYETFGQHLLRGGVFQEQFEGYVSDRLPKNIETFLKEHGQDVVSKMLTEKQRWLLSRGGVFPGEAGVKYLPEAHWNGTEVNFPRELINAYEIEKGLSRLERTFIRE